MPEEILACAAASAAASVAGSGLCVFILQKFFEHKLSENLERFRSRLERTNAEHSIKLDSLQSRRIDAALEISKAIHGVRSNFAEFVTPNQQVNKDQQDRGMDAFAEARTLYAKLSEHYLLLFSPELAETIKATILKVRDAVWDCLYDYLSAHFDDDNSYELKTRATAKGRKLIASTINPAIESLDAEFRDFLHPPTT